jgi:hypothetical protein
VNVADRQVEGLRHLLDPFSGVDVLPEDGGANALHARQPETDVGRHAHRRIGILVWPPTGSDIVFPCDSLDEGLGRGREDQLATSDGNEAVVSFEAGCVLGREHKLPTLTHEGLLMGEGVGDTELLPEQIDERAELRHRYSVRASVFPQETSLDELLPGDQSIAARMHQGGGGGAAVADQHRQHPGVQLAVPGARMKLVGGDSGRVERQELVSGVLVAPSERVVVDVLVERPGELALEHHTPERTYRLAMIQVRGDGGAPTPATRAFEVLGRAPELAAERWPLGAGWPLPQVRHEAARSRVCPEAGGGR